MGLAVVAGAAFLATAFLTADFLTAAFLAEVFPAFYSNTQLLLQQALPLPYL